jgi:NitT/TauT family transport system ATP-binding protein
VAFIDVQHVDKQFSSTTRGSTAALRDMSLAIERGQLVCLVGPSGCGKTTLLNLIAGLDKPDAGRVLVDGKAVTRPGPDRVVMFQDAALFPWLNVTENVAFGMKELGVAKRERTERCRSYLELVNMGSFARAFVHELSGGMRQRVALARALALEPRILLMDEPFGALDAKSRDALQAELVELWEKTQKTIIFVTHDMAEAVRLGSRVIVLKARPARVAHSLDVGKLLPRRRHVDDRRVRELAAELKRGLDDSGKIRLDDAGEDARDDDRHDAHEGSEAAHAGGDRAGDLHARLGLH